MSTSKLFNIYQVIQTTAEYVTDYDFFTKVNAAFFKDKKTQNIVELEKLIKKYFKDPNSRPREALSLLGRGDPIDKSDTDLQSTLFQIQFPLLHPLVLVKELKKNGKLLPDVYIKVVRNAIKDINKGNLKRQFFLAKEVGLGKKVGFPYDIFCIEDTLFATYRKLGQGNFGPVYLVQNLDDGSWGIIELRDKANFDKLKAYEDYVDAFHLSFAPGFPLNSQTLLRRSSSTYELLNIAELYITAAKDLYDEGFLHCNHKRANSYYDPVKQKVSLSGYLPREMNRQRQFKTDNLFGTHAFLAPELLEEERRGSNNFVYNEKTEVYTLGLAIGLMLGVWINANGILKTDQKYFLLQKSLFDETLAVLNQMTHQNPDERFTMDEAISALQVLKSQALWLRSRIKNVGVIDLDDLMEHTKSDKILEKTPILEPLQTMDAVWIFDPRSESQNVQLMNINRVIQSLANNGVTVAGVIANHDKTIPQYNNLVNWVEQKNKNRFMNHYFHITTKRKKIQKHSSALYPIQVTSELNYKQIMEKYFSDKMMTPRHYAWVIKHLYEEISHVKKTKGNSPRHKVRLTALTDTMNSFHTEYSKGCLNYQILNKNLEYLEKNMVHLNRIPFEVCKFFNLRHGSRAANLIRDLREDIGAHQLFCVRS